MKKYLFAIWVVFICGLNPLKAQDIHFSQIYFSPLSLNPIQTGNFTGDWRFSNNYRSQWRSIAIPYKTLSAGFEKQFYLYKEHFSGGIFVLNDQSGAVFLNATKIYLSAAWHKTLKYNEFHLGLQLGYVHKSINTDQATFPSQFDMSTGAFNSSLNNGETGLNDKLGYADINLGLGWSRKFGIFYPELGLTFFHVNFPKETFFEQSNRLSPRTVFSGRVPISLNYKILLTPIVFAMGQKKAFDYIPGARFDYFLFPEPTFFKGVFGGMYFRGTSQNSDALILQAGLTFKKFELGFAYDITLSGLKTANNSRGAWEIGLLYTGMSTVLRKLTVPCERM